MQSIRDNKFILKTQRLEWNKNNSAILMTGGIVSTINGSSFSSRKASYDYKSNNIEFSGIKNYSYKDKNIKSIINVNAEKAIWYGDKKSIYFFSPEGSVKTNLKVYK